MAGMISVIEVKPRRLAVVRVTTVISKWPGQFRQALDKVYEAVAAGHVRQNGQNVMVYHPRHDGRFDIECGVESAESFAPVREVVCSETPSGIAVTTQHTGPYQALGSSHAAVKEWSRQNGYQLTGTCWEIYGDWNEDPAQLQTEIFHLIRATQLTD